MRRIAQSSMAANANAMQAHSRAGPCNRWPMPGAAGNIGYSSQAERWFMAISVICVGNATLDRIRHVPHLPQSGQKMRTANYHEAGGGVGLATRAELEHYMKGA